MAPLRGSDSSWAGDRTLCALWVLCGKQFIWFIRDLISVDGFPVDSDPDENQAEALNWRLKERQEHGATKGTKSTKK
jgi:hypothetical protein